MVASQTIFKDLKVSVIGIPIMSVNDGYTKSAAFFTAAAKTALFCKPCTTHSYWQTSQPIETPDNHSQVHIIPVDDDDLSVRNIPAGPPHLIVDELDRYHHHGSQSNLIEDDKPILGTDKLEFLNDNGSD